jgi:hypothetical protein
VLAAAAAGGAHPALQSSSASSKGKDRPPVLRCGLVEACLRYITETSTLDGTPAFIDMFRSYATTNQMARSRENSFMMLDFTFFHVLTELVQLQSRVSDLLRFKYGIPVEKLTTDGINRQDPAWGRIRETNAAEHLWLVRAVDKLILAIDDAFGNLGSVLFDPVSTCFFIAVHALAAKLNSQSEHNAFMGIACHGIAVVSPPPYPILSAFPAVFSLTTLMSCHRTWSGSSRPTTWPPSCSTPLARTSKRR